jgi:hypothetical protein
MTNHRTTSLVTAFPILRTPLRLVFAELLTTSSNCFPFNQDGIFTSI